MKWFLCGLVLGAVVAVGGIGIGSFISDVIAPTPAKTDEVCEADVSSSGTGWCVQARERQPVIGREVHQVWITYRVDGKDLPRYTAADVSKDAIADGVDAEFKPKSGITVTLDGGVQMYFPPDYYAIE